MDDEVAGLIEQAVVAARAGESPNAAALLTDVYVSVLTRRVIPAKAGIQ